MAAMTSACREIAIARANAEIKVCNKISSYKDMRKVPEMCIVVKCLSYISVRVLKKHLYQRDVCIREMSVSERCLY